MYGLTAPPRIGPGPHDRDLDREVVERLGPRAAQRLHLRAALDLEDAHRVGRLDRRVGRRVVEGDAREVDALAARARDLLDAALDAGQHPQPEQVDLQEARVRAGVLVPLAQLAALHRGRQHRAAVDQRAGRDDHPARVLGEVARQPVGLVAQPRQPRPAAGQRASARRSSPAWISSWSGRRPLTIACHSAVDIANGMRESGSTNGAGGPPGSSPSA